MTRQIMITRTLDECAHDFAQIVANDIARNNVDTNDRHAMHETLRVAIAREMTRKVTNDDDANDMIAFACYMLNHANAPRQPARYRRRVLRYARAIVNAIDTTNDDA